MLPITKRHEYYSQAYATREHNTKLEGLLQIMQDRLQRMETNNDIIRNHYETIRLSDDRKTIQSDEALLNEHVSILNKFHDLKQGIKDCFGPLIQAIDSEPENADHLRGQPENWFMTKVLGSSDQFLMLLCDIQKSSAQLSEKQDVRVAEIRLNETIVDLIETIREVRKSSDAATLARVGVLPATSRDVETPSSPITPSLRQGSTD